MCLPEVPERYARLRYALNLNLELVVKFFRGRHHQVKKQRKLRGSGPQEGLNIKSCWRKIFGLVKQRTNFSSSCLIQALFGANQLI